MNDKEKEICPRLIDFLVVVGKRNRTRGASQSSPDATTDTTVTYPEILRRYPTDDHKDFILPTDVTVFCQPEGCTTTSARLRKNARNDPQFFVFMLTEKDSAKVRYGICLNFYQSFDRRSTPKDEIKKVPDDAHHKKRDSHVSLTSLCFISHHPFVSIFHQVLLLLKRIIDSSNHRAAQRTGLKDVVWAILTGHYNEPIVPEVMKEIKEIETWILMLLSSPVPVPGKTKVQIEVMPMDLSQVFEFALPDHTRFTLIDFPLHIPFEILGIDMALRVLTAAMLEFKIVIQSRNYNAVSMCILSIVALLYPLEYMFPVIPLLPAYMPSAEQLLLAPTPFLIGVPSSFFHHRKIRELPSDVILVDLDTNCLQVPDDLYIPDLPEPDATHLKERLKNAINKMTTMTVDNETSVTDADFGIDIDSVDVACRVAMVQFFNSANVFGNFSEHTRTLRLYPRPVVSLQTDSFLRSRPQCTQLITDLCRTQAVEYFAECCLCPKNETFVRVQAGIESAEQVGDKPKWFSESLMPVHFMVYPNNSTLDSAIRVYNAEIDNDDYEDDSATSTENSNSIDDLVFDENQVTDAGGEVTKPLAEVNYIYKEPMTLELPQSESVVSIDSSLSSGRSSPDSSLSTSAVDSEADFARLADNLALKSNSQGAFSFDHGSDSEYESTPVSQRRKTIHNPGSDASDTPTSRGSIKSGLRMKGLTTLTDSGEKVLGPSLMNAINGYAEKSQSVFSQVINKTAPKAQALKERTMKPLANRIEQSQHIVRSKTQPNPTSQQTANQQSKNQQTVKEFCDQALVGQSVGMFSAPKLKRLMEDESLRELVCSKLNLGLEVKLSEDEYVKEVQLTKGQFKAYVKILKACLEGIEVSFNTPGCCGFASVFHVLEIAHTHYWAMGGGEVITPSSSAPSTMTTPSEHSNDILKESRPKLPASTIDLRTPTKPLGQNVTPTSTNNHEIAQSTRSPALPPPVPPREAPPIPKRNPPPLGAPPKVPEGARAPPPLPPRPKVKTTAVDETPQNLVPNNQPAQPSSPSFLADADEQTKPLLKPAPPTTLPVGKQEPCKVLPTPNEPVRHYIYQELILAVQHQIWQNLQFWENAFVDLVAQEREIVGMDQEPSEMIDRYSALNDSEKKRLELEEDRLLSTLLHNMTAYMIMCGTGQKALQQKVRRLLGKAHIGLVCSKEINKLLDELPSTQGNFIPLKPLGSRLVQKQSFTVCPGQSSDGQMMFMEVCDDAVVLRSITGAATERWWYERLVNITYSPKTKILCLWRRHDDKVHMHKFHTKKCRELYQCMKAAMERAAARGKVNVEGRALGGEFPVHDTETNQGGLLQVRCDGVAVIFAHNQIFIGLSNIKKCNTFGGNVFLLEEFDRKKGEIIQRRYFSQMAVDIAWAMHRVFSVQFAISCQKDTN
ncbi:MAP kinase-activating death domain protein [Caenorhabditis elegans]|uniref:Isoform b of MAP kinase-activating death domain protein n=1 Tax=Caenorhabditis elegans TaxID=6239 RepID=O02626-2|nr:MAP kinase-activating death domain protein [Caenorhabditis elegans]CCD62711.1 MAP kinase-activating death domain protein [Caenorhabditis elegans]|eukprot:NP_001024342.1 MAP kinase-activating death domain protein [Caenorhabditis elegans]